MGMNLNTDAGRDESEPIMDINTTPLIDVMLVLLVMLIITIPIQLHAVNLNLPVGPQRPPPELKPEVVRVDISATGVVSWQGQPLADRAELEARMAAAAAQPLAPELQIRPDRNASYGRFAEVMVVARQQGLTRLGVAGNEQFAPPGRAP